MHMFLYLTQGSGINPEEGYFKFLFVLTEWSQKPNIRYGDKIYSTASKNGLQL